MPNTARPPVRLLLVTLLTLVGLGLGGYLTKHFYEARAGVGDGASCDVNSTVSCTKVAESADAELFSGVPLSSVAAGGFAAMLLLSLLARREAWRANGLRMLTLMAGIATLASLYYIGVMAFKLHTWCLLCLGIDAVDFTLLGLLVSLKPAGPEAVPFNARQWLWAGVLSAAAMIGVFIGLSNFAPPPEVLLPPVAAAPEAPPATAPRPSAPAPAPLSAAAPPSAAASAPAVTLPPAVAAAVEKTLASRTVAVDSAGPFPSSGPASARVTIVEFGDFQCPHCKFGFALLSAISRRYGDRVRIVYRQFPLDMGCNPIIKQPFHLAACESARVAICAHQQKQYEAVTTSLFLHQDELAPGAPQPLGVAAGLDPAELGKCLADSTTSDRLRRDVEEGVRLNIQGTPAYYVNRHPMEYNAQAMPNAVLPALIERLLAAPAQPAPAK